MGQEAWLLTLGQQALRGFFLSAPSHLCWAVSSSLTTVLLGSWLGMKWGSCPLASPWKPFGSLRLNLSPLVCEFTGVT